MTVPAQTTLRPKLIRAGEGQTFTAGPDSVTFHVTGEDTEGAFTVGLVVVQPGGGPPPHLHHREDELFIVLEGQLEGWTPEGWFTARPGDTVFLPAGIPHTYRNTATEPARFYVFVNPSGFEHFYAEFVGVLATPGGPDPVQVMATGEKYGIEFLPPAS